MKQHQHQYRKQFKRPNLAKTLPLAQLEQLAKLAPRSRIWMLVKLHGRDGATYQQIVQVLAERIRCNSNMGPLHWRHSCAIPPAKGQPRTYVGTYVSGALINMLNQGYLIEHPELKGPRGGRVYYISPQCKVPLEAAMILRGH